MAFAPGDTVVHPQHGTATVEGMVRRDVGRGPEEYLQLYIQTRSLKILVPSDAVAAVGIRSVSTKREAEGVLAILEEPSDVPVGWSQRSATTTDRLRSRDLGEVSMVVRDLSRHQRRTGKPLTLREGDVLKGCLDMLAAELCLALGMSKDDTKTLIVETSLRDAGPDGELRATQAPAEPA